MPVIDKLIPGQSRRFNFYIRDSLMTDNIRIISHTYRIKCHYICNTIPVRTLCVGEEKHGEVWETESIQIYSVGIVS